MQKKSRYTYAVAQKQIIYPGKLILMNDVIKWDVVNQKAVNNRVNVDKKVIEKKFHNFEISNTSRSKIIKKISWLFHCAKSKSVKSYSGKEIYNFKVNFITLTLPSKQNHPTSQITKDCFERFLNEMRTRCKMANYVWRLEFQNNGNVHYHLVTDTYIDYSLVLKVWNRIINYLGYVDAYCEKMSKLKFHEYVSLFPNVDFEVLNKRYIKGRANKWKCPNSVDVKNANSQKNISMYISKYFSKKKTNAVKCNELDNQENSFGLRLWFSSRSLSKMDTIHQFVGNVTIPLEKVIETCKNVLKVVHDYCTVYYFDFNELSTYYKKLVGTIFTKYQQSKGYIPDSGS
jgi:hypothetical protein